MSVRRNLAALVTAALLFGTIGGQAQAAAALFVDDDGAQCPGALTTIQAAVNAAAGLPGRQEIKVCPGTYVENVVIGAGNSVSLEGEGIVTVKPVAGTAGPVFDVTSAGRVDIKGLRIDGGSAMVGDVVRGIRYTNTDGKIADNEVLNIRDAGGGAQGLGIRVQSEGSGTSNVRVHDNVVRNYTRAGIIANGVGVTVRIDGNTVIGPVAPKVWAPNGIQVSRGARGLVEGNSVQNASDPSGSGSGVLLFCAGPTIVKGNRVSASDVGIAVADNADAMVIGNDVRDSVFDAYSLQSGINAFFGGGLGCPGTTQPTTNNTLLHNTAAGSVENGISLVGFDPANLSAGPTGNSIRQNDVRASGKDGIHVLQGTGNSFVANRIRDSVNKDAVDDTTGSGTAGTGNTWTANRCATSQPTGLCAD